MPENSGRTIGTLLMFGFLHCILGVAGSVSLGILPEAFLSRYYFNTGIEAFAPAVAVTALILGFAFGGIISKGQGASLAWIFGLLWLGIGILDVRKGWNPAWSPEPSAWAHVKANLFGKTSACGDSECLNELFVTMPFTASVMYSLGAFIRTSVASKSPPD